MPTTDVTNTLIATIVSTEQSSGNIPINRGTGNPSFNVNVGQFTTYFALADGANNIALPFTPITQLYIKNIDATNYIKVSWTPGGGVSGTVLSLNPGDQILFWGNPAGITPGIAALILTTTVAGVLCEYFLGG